MKICLSSIQERCPDVFLGFLSTEFLEDGLPECNKGLLLLACTMRVYLNTEYMESVDLI